MHRRLRSSAALVTLTVPIVLMGCGGGSNAPDEPPALTMVMDDQGCTTDRLEAEASGTIRFDVTNNASKRGEFELVSAEPAIVYEGFLAAGTRETNAVMLRPGTYQVICINTNTPNRARLVVGGGGTATDAPASTAELEAAAAEYTTYVRQQARLLQQGTTRFTNAVRAGDTARAKALYAEVRIPWEAIEPIAEAFPDADAAIDSRADDHAKAEADPGFVGFHAIEYGLWAQGTKDGARANLSRLADRLDTDVAALVKEVNGLEVSPSQMINGAAALMDEAAQTKVTGEEERYSRTDLMTLASNLKGSQKVMRLIDQPLAAANPQLHDDIRIAFRDVDRVLNRYALPNGRYQPYDRVSDEDRNLLKTSMASLAELLSQVAGTLGVEVAG